MANYGDLKTFLPGLTTHPLNRTLSMWYLSYPSNSNGRVWRDLVTKNDGTLTNMSGPRSGFRRGRDQTSCYGSMEFDGVDDYISPATSLYIPSGIGATFTASVRIDKNTGFNQTIFATYQAFPGNIQYTFRVLATNFLEMFVRTIGTDAQADDATQALVLGRWYRLGTVVDDAAKTVNLYIDGRWTGVTTSIIFALSGATPAMSIGAATGVNVEPLNGGMNDVKMWKRVLSHAEMRTDYEQSISGSPTLLVYPPRIFRSFFGSAASASRIRAQNHLINLNGRRAS